MEKKTVGGGGNGIFTGGTSDSDQKKTNGGLRCAWEYENKIIILYNTACVRGARIDRDRPNRRRRRRRRR